MNTSLVTALSHYSWFGYRNFDTPDNSVNNRVGSSFLHGEKCCTTIINIGEQQVTAIIGQK